MPDAGVAVGGALMEKYEGNDNYGTPKAEYLSKISSMSDEALWKECESKIWLSAYAANNPRSDYHWHAVACYDECQKRKKPEIYKAAYKSIEESL